MTTVRGPSSSAVRGAAPFLGVGGASVVAGGLVSAATAGAPTQHSAWAVAYLVLVAGVAQIGLGMAELLAPPRGARPSLLELACWNVGNAAVLAGVLVSVTTLVDVGGILLCVALALALHGVRGWRPQGAAQWLLHGFRLLVVVLAVSIPIGLVLAR